MDVQHIQKKLGLSDEDFEFLQRWIKEVVDPVVEEEPKRYWHTPCPHCNGSGRTVAKSSTYKVFERLQDEDLGEVADFDSSTYALAYVAERRLMPLGTSSMFTIVAPNGEVIDA